MEFYVPKFYWNDDMHADDSVNVVNSFDSSILELDNFIESLEDERVVTWFVGPVAKNERYLGKNSGIEAAECFKAFLDLMSSEDKIVAVYIRQNEGSKYISSKFTILSKYLSKDCCDKSLECTDFSNNNQDIHNMTLSNLSDDIKKQKIFAVIFSARDKMTSQVNEYTVFVKYFS